MSNLLHMCGMFTYLMPEHFSLALSASQYNLDVHTCVYTMSSSVRQRQA